LIIKGGTTDVTTYFVLRSTTDGTELTGATITNIDLQYVRTGVAPVAKVDATALGATDSAHADNKAIEIDATDQPGLYRVDWPDAAFAAGVLEVILTVKYTGAFTEHLRVTIDPIGAPVGASISADIAAIWNKALTEPTAVVAASPTAIAALSWLLTLSRNKITQTATTQLLKADDGSTTIATSTVSDDGVTATRGEFA